nr:unnamed protein product [Digitaria exilis]
MPSSASSFAAAAAGGGSILSGPSSTLSPNAAPYTLLARQGRAPPGRLQDGDALRFIDDNFVLNGEDNNSYSVSLATNFGVKTSNAVYPSSAHGICQRMNIQGILKGIESMSEVLFNNCSDEMELEEHDYSLLQSVIENLQSCLHKARKVPAKGFSDKAGGLKACFSQNAVSKSVIGNCIGSYTGDNGKGIIISNPADSSRLFRDSRKKCVTGYQPSLSNFPKELSCEEDHSKALIYKKLWIDAERANCALKYQLKQTCMEIEIDLDSSRAHGGGGPRIPSFHLCDMGGDASTSYGSAITSAPMLKDRPGARKSHDLLYAADHVQSGVSNVL